jgi:hypothetical protein
MQMPEKTIDHGTLRRLIDAGAQVGVDVIGSEEGWGVVIHYGSASQTLAATRGRPRTFKQFETLAGYLKEFGITEYRVDSAGFDVGATARSAPDQRSRTASDRMKRAHQAAAYDAWFRQEVQASLDDPRPSLGDDQAREQMQTRRDALLRKSAGKAGS